MTATPGHARGCALFTHPSQRVPGTEAVCSCRSPGADWLIGLVERADAKGWLVTGYGTREGETRWLVELELTAHRSGIADVVTLASPAGLGLEDLVDALPDRRREGDRW